MIRTPTIKPPSFNAQLHKPRARLAAKQIRAMCAQTQNGAGVDLIRHWPTIEPLRRAVQTGRRTVQAGRRLCIAGYAPTQSEIDPMPLMRALADEGHRLALPCVKRVAHPLEFRAYSFGEKLRRGAYGILTPPRTNEVVTPDVVLLPLLAFDRLGYRLGYGGGFYDRSLEQLRSGAWRDDIKAGEAEFMADFTGFACGLAYSGQEIPRVSIGPHDQRLDGVLTPDGFLGGFVASDED